MTKEIINIKEQEEKYDVLLEECRAIIVEKRFRATCELVGGKWELGKRIHKEGMNFKRGLYGKRTIENLAKDLEMSNSHLWKCVQFFKKYQLDSFEEVIPKIETDGKMFTWYQITQKVLPKPREELDKEEKEKEKQEACSHARFKCLDCGKEFSLEELKKLL